MTQQFPVVAAGREIPDAYDRIRRYCGAAWSGGPPETWAWAYYDEVPSYGHDTLRREDVLAAGVLRPGLRRNELEFFRENAREIPKYLRDVAADVDLANATTEDIGYVDLLLHRFEAVGIGLLSKVLHRKRPRLIPLLDRTTFDWYRPISGERGADAWPRVVRLIQSDLRLERNVDSLQAIAERLRQELDESYATQGLSSLRLFDIAMWMAAR